MAIAGRAASVNTRAVLSKEEKEAQKRLAETLQFMETLSTWGDEMLKLEPATLMKVMKLGTKIQKLIRGN